MQYARQTLVRDFLASFSASTGAQLAGGSAPEEGRFVTVAGVTLPGRPGVLELALTLMTSAYPRDVRNVVDRLSEYRAGRCRQEDSVALVVLGEHLSEGARQALRAAGVNYFDRSGTLYFRHDTWFCDIQREARRPPTRRPVALFSGTREQVVHALLMAWHRSDGQDWLTGTELAREAGTSTATVSTAMQELERLEWVEVTGSGPRQRRRLRDAGVLLDAWADVWAHRLRNERRSRWYAYASRVEDLERRLAQGLAQHSGWAFTGPAPANRTAPLLTLVDRVSVIVPPGAAQEWAEHLQLKSAERGANVTLIERQGASVQFSTLDSDTGVRTASPFVQYLDLLDGVGRNKELAAELRSRTLRLPPAAPSQL